MYNYSQNQFSIQFRTTETERLETVLCFLEIIIIQLVLSSTSTRNSGYSNSGQYMNKQHLGHVFPFWPEEVMASLTMVHQTDV